MSEIKSKQFFFKKIYKILGRQTLNLLFKTQLLSGKIIATFVILNKILCRP